MRLPRAKKPAPATTAISEPSANHSTSAPVVASVVVVVEVVGDAPEELVAGGLTQGLVLYSQSKKG